MNIQSEIIEQRRRIKNLASKVDFNYKTGKVIVRVSDAWKKISEGVHITRCSLDNRYCTVMNLTFDVGGQIESHVHDSNDKKVFIVDGTLYDIVNDKMYTEGDVIDLPMGISHGFKSDYALITVTYKPPLEIEERKDQST